MKRTCSTAKRSKINSARSIIVIGSQQRRAASHAVLLQRDLWLMFCLTGRSEGHRIVVDFSEGATTLSGLVVYRLALVEIGSHEPDSNQFARDVLRSVTAALHLVLQYFAVCVVPIWWRAGGLPSGTGLDHWIWIGD